MKTLVTCLLLFCFLVYSKTAAAQNVSGATTIVPGQSYSYSYQGPSCYGYPQYSWRVEGGVVTADDYAGNITVTWSCSATTRNIYVDLSYEEYDGEYGYYYPVYCGSGSLSNFTTAPPIPGNISLYYANSFSNYLPSNTICPNQVFSLGYDASQGVQQVSWSRWDGVTWQPAGTSSAPNLTKEFPGISAPTTYRAQPIACGGVQLAAQTFVVQLVDITVAAGVALGSRDVLFAANEGIITLADYNGGIIMNWQRSTDAGLTWTDLLENTEELSFSSLTITSLFRAKLYYLPCQTFLYSQPCTIRVDMPANSLSWIENKSYDGSTQLVSNSRAYFDLSGRLLQSQTKNISRGTILAVQPLFSRYDQAVGSTLAAPILESTFTYKPRFVTPAFNPSVAYNYNHFDGTPVGKDAGTLGWYYSTSNNLEPSTATTSYPYSRTEEAPDGSTGVVRSSGVGEVFRIGQGKENVQGSFGVRSELVNYAQLRSRYFPNAVAGEHPVRFSDNATQQVSINSNGQKAISFQDKEGRTLMTARPGTLNNWLTAANTVEIGWPYSLAKNANEFYENAVIEATADIVVYDAQNIRLFTGHARDYNATLSARAGSCRIYCNEPFRVITGRILNATTMQPLSWNSMYELPAVKREAYAYFNFYTFSTGATSVSPIISGSEYTVTNTSTGADVSAVFRSGSGTIPAGFYQIRIIHGAVTLSYRNDYQDISYNFYNQKGQLLGSLAPNGAKLVIANSSAYPTVASLPFYTSYEYDVQGRLLALNETEAGRTQYYYRADGTIRFSQNAKQRPLGHFSYTNYDDVSRPVEAGECRPASPTYFTTLVESAGFAAILESTASRGGFALEHPRQDVILTAYDLPVTTPSVGATYTQDYLAGQVSNTRKYALFNAQTNAGTITSQTWFSYDEQGRSKWVIRQQFGQAAHTLDYDYDFNGKVLSVCYQRNNPATRFTHYYSYDADQRLAEVSTNTADPSAAPQPKKVQATYAYYLHGPLRRMVIGGMQGVDYLYTAQGWLKSINGIQPGSDPDGFASPADLFSQELEYYAGDYYSARRPQGTVASTGNHPERFDGTVRAQVWRTPSRPAAMNGYGYRYDERGHLSHADYGALILGTNGNASFTPDLTRFQEGNFTYDPNGNLGDLRRTGRPTVNLMNIKYDYVANTNKLARVYNPATSATTISYGYDELGQMTSQLETGKPKYFTYDVSGKVTDVRRAAGNNAADLIAHYDYDEYGQRIRQVVYNAQQVAETTQYVRDVAGNEVASYYIAPNTTALLLAEQPVYGAARVGLVRQPRGEEPRAELYELNDQLGNTRVVFQAPRTDTYLLTMEMDKVTQEKKDFPTPTAATYDAVRSKDYARGDTPDGSGWAIRLINQIGPGKKLAIAPGDEVRLEVWAGYPAVPGGVILGRAAATPLKPGLLAGATLLTQTPQRPQAEGPGTRPLPAWQRLLSQVSLGVAIPLTARQPKLPPNLTAASARATAAPNAVLRYTLRLVRDGSVVNQGSTAVTSSAQGTWAPLSLNVNVAIEEPAELEVWVQSNDTAPIYFDDLKIEHQVGSLVAENHFYPYGQRNDALSWTRPYLRSYGRGYQGQNTRFDEETGYDNFELRLYDSRIGRWLSTDPMGQYHSPYVGMGNNPVNRVDPDGGFDWWTDFWGGIHHSPDVKSQASTPLGGTYRGETVSLPAEGGASFQGDSHGHGWFQLPEASLTGTGGFQLSPEEAAGYHSVANGGAQMTAFAFEAMIPWGRLMKGAVMVVQAYRAAQIGSHTAQVTRILMPGGKVIGSQMANNRLIRTVTPAKALSIVSRLIHSGAKLAPKQPLNPSMTLYNLPGGGTFGVRTAVSSNSIKLGSTGAIDINIPGIPIKNIKF